jgi:hypothetical protein
MPAEQQYALVRNGALVVHREHPITTFHPAEDLRGDWLPIVNEDSEPFDPSKHWRLSPQPLVVDGVQRVRPRLTLAATRPILVRRAAWKATR